MIKKCAGRISFLYRHSSSLDFDCRRILCNSLVQPYLDYCCSTWYSSLSQRLKSKLEVIQRRMVKFVYSKDSFYHVDPRDFKNLSWLTFPDRVRFFNLMHVFKIRAGKAPSYLSVNFRSIAQSHGFNTRRSTYDYVVSRDVAASSQSFVFTAIKQWNSLPQSLKCVGSLQCFKTRLKQHLFFRVLIVSGFYRLRNLAVFYFSIYCVILILFVCRTPLEKSQRLNGLSLDH